MLDSGTTLPITHGSDKVLRQRKCDDSSTLAVDPTVLYSEIDTRTVTRDTPTALGE